MPEWLQAAYTLLAAAAAAGGAYVGVSVKIAWLRADIEQARARLDCHQRRLNRLEQGTPHA